MPNPDSQGIDDEVERIIKRYKKYVERKARYAYEAFEDKDDSFTRASQQIKMQDSEFKFIKEVIYNYLDLDVNKKRRRIMTSSRIDEESYEESKEIIPPTKANK